MKKSLKKILLTLFVAFMATGCVKMDVSMSINKDKSMNLVMIMAVNKQLLEQSGETGNMLDDDELKELKEQGFKVEDYKENSMEGYKASRKIKNIDAISTKDEITSDLSMTQTDNKNEYLFTVKKGFLKNTYIANITSSDSKSIEDQIDKATQDNDTTTTDDNATDDLGDFDYSALMSSMDMKFAVKVPYKALNNNATNVSDDGKTLTWNLLELKEDKMHFEFELYNMTNIYILAGIVILIVLMLIFFLIKRKNNKKINLDNSNQGELNNSSIEKPVDTIMASNTTPNIQPNSMSNIPVNPIINETSNDAKITSLVEPTQQQEETSQLNNVEMPATETINADALNTDNNNQIQNTQTETNQDNQQI